MPSTDVKNQVKEATDIVEVAARYLRLKKSGKNLVALCPFHREKTPSFSINPHGQFYYCFGCGKKGDVFSLVMEMEGLTFPEALAMLAERAGISVRAGAGTDVEQARRLARARSDLMRLNGAAERFYHAALRAPEGASALEYVRGRGFTDETIERFGVGYAPATWDALVRHFEAKGLKRAWLLSAGLARESADGAVRDYFRNRLIFPVRNAEGRVIAFGGRALAAEDQPKYLNSPDTPVFKKGRTLFGLDLARPSISRRGSVLVMEGYTDVMMSHQAGIDWSVATLGTAFSQEAATALARIADAVVLVFDGDEAGQKAAARALGILLAAGATPGLLLLPAGHDPCSHILERGAAAFAELVERGAVDGFRWLLDEKRRTVDLGSPHQRARAAREMAEFVAGVSDALLKGSLLDAIAEAFRVSRALVADAAAPGAHARADMAKPAEADNLSLLDKARRELIAFMCRQPHELAEVRRRLDVSFWPAELMELMTLLEQTAERTALVGDELLAHVIAEHSDLSEVLLPAVGAHVSTDSKRLIQHALGFSRALTEEQCRAAPGDFALRQRRELIRQQLKTLSSGN